MKDTVKIKGFIRLMAKNVRNGKEEYTPWFENVITADGFQNYIVGPVGGLTGSKIAGFIQLATQTTAPSSTQTSASGEFEARKSTSNSFITNGTFQMTASFNTNEATQSVMGAIAAYNTSSGGTAGSIATFATSQKTTDQVLNVTYQWRFS
jgi:hypothetical protein